MKFEILKPQEEIRIVSKDGTGFSWRAPKPDVLDLRDALNEAYPPRWFASNQPPEVHALIAAAEAWFDGYTKNGQRPGGEEERNEYASRLGLKHAVERYRRSQ